MAPENVLASGHPGSQGWRQSIPGQGSPQGLRVRPRERCDMSGPSQPGKFYPTHTRAPPGSFLPSWSPTHVLSHGAHPPVNLDLILRWGGWPRRQGARHTILYLLALAQKVSSATFPGLSTGRYFTMKRWGIIVYPDGNSMEIRRLSSTFLPTFTQNVPVGRLCNKDIGPSEMLYKWRVQILSPLSKIPKPPKPLTSSIFPIVHCHQWVIG